MGSKIILIVEINGTDNTKSIGDNVKFVSEAEMSFDVLLFHFMVRGIGCGYGSIDSFIWIVRTVKVIGLCIGFELLNDAVGVYRIVFCHISFNAGSIKQKQGGKIAINVMAYQFGHINKFIKKRL